MSRPRGVRLRKRHAISRVAIAGTVAVAAVEPSWATEPYPFPSASKSAKRNHGGRG